MGSLWTRFPDYPEMFANLIGQANSRLSFDSVTLVDGAPLPDPGTLDGVLITGSPSGVYDPEPWIPPLMDFIRWTAASRIPQVGICFGHQAMAQALGGKVVKSEKGWGIGRHTYAIENQQAWMGEVVPPEFSLAVSHQDQVTLPPPSAEVTARSEFCPFAGLSYAQGSAISFQGHPEYSDAFASALYESRRSAPLSNEEVDGAKRSLSQPHDNALLGQWIANFFAPATEPG
ncbi:MAG: type 1 glutamine amidotransferase [Pseudomonadota bacterium]